MQSRIPLTVCAWACLGLALLMPRADADVGVAAPEFSHRDAAEWLNSAPLDLAALRGQVVLLEVWAFDCWNCARSLPWLRTLTQNYAAATFRVIGVHTPELAQERVRANVVAKVAELGVTWPVMLDTDMSYWQALGNRYWPAFYLLDRAGRVRAVFVGETHVGDAQALEIERAIAALLAEAAPS